MIRGLMMGLEQGLPLGVMCITHLLLFYYPLSFFVSVVVVTIYVLAITDQRCGCLTETGDDGYGSLVLLGAPCV